MYKEDYVDLNIVNGTSIIRSYVNKHIGEGDELGDVFGVRVYRNGTPVSMSEVSVWGWFIRPDGNTVIIQGEKNGNSVWVKLPEACYVFD